MARLPREDGPGTWHHVMNRGVARRTLFERSADMRVFLALVAWRVRARELELHAYCLMGTHYHLLVRSPVGRLAAAMQRIQLGYSRYFNRSRRRDGSLVRGRYRSKPVRSEEYKRHLVAYIDSNPVKAGLVADSSAYRHGSAYHYSRPGFRGVRSDRGPIWLERGWVESVVQRTAGASTYSCHDYRRVFGRVPPRSIGRIIEARIACRSRSDPLDDLVSSSPAGVAAWMRRKARLADGTAPGMPVCDPQDVEESVARLRGGAAWTTGSSSSRDAWDIARTGLWIELCGSTRLAVARRLACSDTTVGKLYERHRRALAEDPLYAERVGQVASQALRVWSGVGG